jgi:hypothetical protein
MSETKALDWFQARERGEHLVEHELASRDLSPTAGGVRHQNPPMVACDLCDWPLLIPEHCLKAGRIEGLLVCTTCTEDTLTARLLENTL